MCARVKHLVGTGVQDAPQAAGRGGGGRGGAPGRQAGAAGGAAARQAARSPPGRGPLARREGKGAAAPGHQVRVLFCWGAVRPPSGRPSPGLTSWAPQASAIVVVAAAGLGEGSPRVFVGAAQGRGDAVQRRDQGAARAAGGGAGGQQGAGKGCQGRAAGAAPGEPHEEPACTHFPRGIPRTAAGICVLWMCICLDTSAGPEPSYLAYQMRGSHSCS